MKDPPTFDQAQRLRRFDSRTISRKGLLEAAELFKGDRGVPARIEPTEYPALAVLGDRLTPACKRILVDYEATPSRSITMIVEECRTEFAEAGTFLLRHVERLKSALEDRKLLYRARRIDTRARLLADAMAGAEYALSLRTAVERARTGRRGRS